MDEQVIGVLGGGQLGRMMAQAASRLSIPLITLDAENSPASQVSNPQATHLERFRGLKHHIGSFNVASDVEEFSKSVDILTVEIEHVDVAALQRLEQDPTAGRQGKGVKIYPSPRVLCYVQDKFIQKQFLSRHAIPIAEFEDIQPSETLLQLQNQILDISRRLGFPLMLKSRRLGYDGRGNALVNRPEDIDDALLSFEKGLAPGAQTQDLHLYAERFVPFTCEIAVMVVRAQVVNSQTDPPRPHYITRTYPPVQTVHKNSICHAVYSPLRKGGSQASAAAVDMAVKAIEALGEGAVGVFGVEMFLLPDGRVLLNEIAPRPHNSYHHTISSTPVSQFTAHLLAISSHQLPPPGSFELAVPAAAMINILGYEDGFGEKRLRKFVELVSQIEGTSVELYGKAVRPGRKVGHVNVLGKCEADVQKTVSMIEYLLPSALHGLSLQEAFSKVSNPLPGFSHPHPLVSIIMGSDSDLPTMIEASRILSNPIFNVPHELSIVSAHRTPRRMTEFAQAAARRGVKVIIAGAGGAAHLPGMVSALTPLPVIGVPVQGKVLDGQDSLHSIVQMPRGIPVATVAIGNPTNAGLLAIRILSVALPRLMEAMELYMKQMEDGVLTKVEALEEIGWEAYTRNMLGKS